MLNSCVGASKRVVQEKRERLDRIDDAFLYERSIDQQTYERKGTQRRPGFVPEGLRFDGKGFGAAVTCLAFQEVGGKHWREFRAGVPKHSELEPSYGVTPGDGGAQE